MKKQGLKTILFLLGIVLLTVVIYSNSFKGDFVWDDKILIEDNPIIRVDDPLILFTGQFFPETSWNPPGYFRPIVALSYWLEYRFFGLNPFMYHLNNLMFHILVIILFYVLLKKYFHSKNINLVVLACLFFATHPYHTESVTFISGRTDVMASIFFLSAFILYIMSRDKKRILPICLSVVAFIIGILCKELVIVLPVVLIFYEIFSDKRDSLYEIGMRVLPFFIAAVLYVPLRISLLGTSDISLITTMENSTLLVRIFYAPYFLAKYLVMLAYPFTFNSFRLVRFTSIHFGIREILTTIIVIGYMGLLIALLLKKKWKAAFWWLFISIGLSLVLNIIPIQGASLAERFLYLPSLGFCYILALGIQKLNEKFSKISSRVKPGSLIALIIVLLYSGATYIRNFDWRNELMAYNAMLEKNPRNAIGHICLASVYKDLGEYDSAMVHARAAVANQEWMVPGWLIIANIHRKQGNYESAERVLTKAKSLSPTDWHVYNDMGVLEFYKGNYEVAREYYLKSLQLKPQFVRALMNMGYLEMEVNNYPRALEFLLEAYRLRPDDPKLCIKISETYETLGNNPKAREFWHRYLSLPGIKFGETVGEEDAPGVLPPPEQRE